MGFRHRRALRFVAANAAAVAVLLVLFETAVRLAMPEVRPLGVDASLFEPAKYGPSYGYRADARGVSMGAAVVTDGNGFRIDPDMRPVGPEDRVLMVAGDSVSVGIGVEAQDSFAFLLDRLSRERRVVNAAVTGHALDDTLRVLEHALAERRVDRVVLGLCLNDFQAASQGALLPGIAATPTPAEAEAAPADLARYPDPVLRWLRQANDAWLDVNGLLRAHSRGYLVAKALAADTQRNHFMAELEFYRRPDAAAAIDARFAALAALADAHDTPIDIVVFPFEYQLREREEALLEPQRLIRAAAERRGFRVLDLYEPFRRYIEARDMPADALYLFGDPMHLSPQGHALAAAVIHRELAQAE